MIPPWYKISKNSLWEFTAFIFLYIKTLIDEGCTPYPIRKFFLINSIVVAHIFVLPVKFKFLCIILWRIRVKVFCTWKTIIPKKAIAFTHKAFFTVISLSFFSHINIEPRIKRKYPIIPVLLPPIKILNPEINI